MTRPRFALAQIRWFVFAVIACLATAGLLVLAGSADAAQKSSDTIDLCITMSGPDKGSVRFVKPRQGCKSGELLVQVARGSDQQGVQGSSDELGPVGPRGAKGDKGDKGDRGLQGPAGQDGADGKDGTDGIDGIDGKDGAPGPEGKEGPQGPQGPEGKQGPTGPAGPNGATGYLRLESTSANGTGNPEVASTTVTCTGGRKIVGGGYQVNAGSVSGSNNPAEVTVTQNRATSDTVWSVTAIADERNDVGTWSVTAYAICANVGS
jgi:hypothetical protein